MQPWKHVACTEIKQIMTTAETGEKKQTGARLSQRACLEDELKLWDLHRQRTTGGVDALTKVCWAPSLQASADGLGNVGCGGTAGRHGAEFKLHRSMSDSSIIMQEASKWALGHHEMPARKQTERRECQDGNHDIDSQSMRQAPGSPHRRVISAIMRACSPREAAASDLDIGEQTKRSAIVPVAPVRPLLPPRSASSHGRRGFALAALMRSAQRVTPTKHGTAQDLGARAPAVAEAAAVAAAADSGDASTHPAAGVAPVSTAAQEQPASPLHELLVVPAFRRVMPACPI